MKYIENISKKITMNNCRICHHKLYPKPLLRLKNMPQAAQFFPDKKNLKEDRGFNMKIYQCSGCGLVQLNSEPVSYYKQVIRASSVSAEMKDFRIKQFTNFLKKYSLIGKKVIEIGTGKGEYLTLIKKCGVKAYGLEYSQESVDFCNNNGLNVYKGYLNNANVKLKNTPFDAFFILNFLEHLPDPNSVLKGIYNNLTVDGVGLVEVPNFDMILRKNLFSEFIADHLFYFTKETLSSTLTINGFEIIGCEEIFHDYIISAIVKKRQRLDISHFYSQQDKIKKDIYRYISKFKKKKVAIWGAGHQALAIMSLVSLTDKIRYVVDSALFKQGCYTPVTHLLIVSPDALKTNQIEAIIVIAGGYSDEVVKTIQQKYDKINIAVLRDYGLEIIKS